MTKIEIKRQQVIEFVDLNGKHHATEDAAKLQSARDVACKLLEFREIDWHNEEDELLHDEMLQYMLDNREVVNAALDWYQEINLKETGGLKG